LGAVPQEVRAEASSAEQPTPKSVQDVFGLIERAFRKAPEAEVLFPRLQGAVEKRAPMLSGGRVVLEPRLYYFKRDNPDGSESEAFTGGGRLHFDTGWLYDFISLGGSYYRSDKIVGDDDKTGTGLLAFPQKSYDVLGEAYLSLRYDEQKATFYRQTLDLPYLNKNDSRMVPNTFEAYLLEGRFEDVPALGNVSYAAGYVDQIKLRTADEFISMSDAAEADVADRGLITAGALLQPHPDYSIGAINHYVDDLFNTFYLESNYIRKLTDELEMRVEGQFTHQQSVGDDLLMGGTNFNTWAMGGQVWASWKGLMVKTAVSKNHDDQHIRNPYGSYPGYLSLMQTDFKLANEEAWLLGISYDFERVGWKGLSSFANYAEGRRARTAEGEELPDRKEFNITADYKVEEGLLRGLWLRVRWSNLDLSETGSDGEELRIILNFELPLL